MLLVLVFSFLSTFIGLMMQVFTAYLEEDLVLLLSAKPKGIYDEACKMADPIGRRADYSIGGFLSDPLCTL